MLSFRLIGRRTKIVIPILVIVILSLSWVFSKLYWKYIILAPHERIQIPDSLTFDYSELEDDGSESNELSTGVLGDFIHGDEQDGNYQNYKVLSTYDQRSLSSNNNGEIYERESAVFFTFVSQVSDYFGLLRSIRTVEDRFNRKFKYDWVFAYANEDGIPEKLQGYIRRMTSGETFFVKVPTAEESPNDCTYCYPNTFSKSEIEELKKEIKSSNLGPYSKFEKYRLKMRFQSFGFQNLEIMKNYRYYCNVDIEMDLSCDIDFDFFKFMSKHNKIFGFANASPEPKRSFSSFFNVITEYKDKLSLKDSTTKSEKLPTLYPFLINDNGKDYSKCAFNSDFEIFDLEFLRSKEYEELFRFVDSKNGFFHERWTASMIHTLAVSLLLDENDIFFFYSTGITDGEYRTVCPISKNIRLKNKCSCQIHEDYTWSRYSCLRKYFDSLNLQLPDNVPGVDLKNYPIKFKSMRFSHKKEEKKSSLDINYLDDDDPLLHKFAKINKLD
ncbi:unnamed protein product [[Candida] boidinii]|uniref:Unnamed protein product n=1 Tax=Candida boidinii TaxID=5477 RepID=A0ACB5TDQ5_CANBO|nr:unnamed protein product [[Candida] boidinii]